MANVGPMELFVVLIVVLLVFGPKRLPEMGSSLGKGMRDFRAALAGEHQPDEKQPPEAKQELPVAEEPATGMVDAGPGDAATKSPDQMS
jgi:sec-independent protein translocase protein TatA